MRDRIEIAVICFQDFIDEGYSFKAATEKSLFIQMTADILFMRLKIENPTDDQFGEAVACLTAIIQGAKKDDA